MAYTAEERERLLEEREKRAKRYGIRPQEGRPLTPPADYPDDPDEYGDPVNYAYPIDEEHIRPAIAYFNHEGQREAGGYSHEEWRIIGERIARAATRLLGAEYEYRDGKVVRVEEEKSVKVLKDEDDIVILGGYAAVFGGADLVGDTFTPETDFWLDKPAGPRPVLYDHSFERFGLKVLGMATLTPDENGLWVEAQLQRSEEYRRLIEPLVRAGVLGWSTGAPAHLVRREGNVIRSWPIVEVSLTPTPAEPRTLGVSELASLSTLPMVKSLLAESGESSGNLPLPQETSAEYNPESEEVEMNPELISQIADEVAARITATRSVPFAVTEEADAVKAFNLWLRRRETPETMKTMREGAGSEGGFLVPAEFQRELVTALAQQSILRQAGARVLRVRSARVEVPALNFSGAATLTAEEGNTGEAEPTFGQIVFTPYKFTRLTRVTEELLADAAFDVWAQVLQPDFVQAFAAAENQYFTTGTGSGQPQGVVTAAPVGVTTAASNAITADEIIDVYHSLNYLYRQKATWMMHDSVAAVIRKMKDSTGQYIWQPGLAEGQPDRLLGRPVITNNLMPTIAAGAKVIIFGDFSYYWIAEREEMTVKRLDELYAATGHIGFRATMRVDGRVVLSAAFTALRMKPS